MVSRSDWSGAGYTAESARGFAEVVAGFSTILCFFGVDFFIGQRRDSLTKVIGKLDPDRDGRGLWLCPPNNAMRHEKTS
jgi:hypothetical protein